MAATMMPKVACHGMVIFLWFLASSSTHGQTDVETIEIRMPGVRPTNTDSYLCTYVKLPLGTKYIVHFEPKASQKVAHHMLLFGCKKPGSYASNWRCGGSLNMRWDSSPCSGSEQIIFAWAKDAPPRQLPSGVGFEIGGFTSIQYLVLQVHYAQPAASSDESGFLVQATEMRQPFNAGIFLLWAGIAKIPPETNGVHVDIACQFKEQTIFAFAYRTHAHKLARVITGYLVRNGVWTLLGRGNPQAPQAFYPMKKEFEIRPGDILAARCTYDTIGHHLTHTVGIGSDASDEMCNFYIMFYTDSNRELSVHSCAAESLPDVYASFPADSDSPVEADRQSDVDAGPSPSIAPGSTRGNVHEHPLLASENGDGAWDRKPTHPEEEGEVNSDGVLSVDQVDHYEVQITTPSPPDVAATDLHQSDTRPVDPTPSPKTSLTFAIVKDWPRLSKADVAELGQISGVAIDSKGRVVIFHRGSRVWEDSTFNEHNILLGADRVGPIPEHTVWLLHPATGEVLAKWGESMFYLPHGLTIDHDDNLWLTDVGSHQVFKFSPLTKSSKRLLELGESLVPGNDDTHFCKPTDVAVERSGDFFVADGYCNNRIMKFSAEGKLLRKWGRTSQNVLGDGIPLPGTFRIPHSVTLDEQSLTLFVADRENGRIQSFNSSTSRFLEEVFLPEFGGRVFAVDYNKVGGVIHVVNGPSLVQRSRHTRVSGLTIRAADGALLHEWPAGKQVFEQPHALASSPNNMDVYVAEIGPNRVWKLSKRSDLGVQTTSSPPHPGGVSPSGTKPTASKENTTALDTAARNQDTSANQTTWSSPSRSTDLLGNLTSDSLTEEEFSIAPPGVVPALIILSVLAVPVIFLLLVSIVLRIQAYRRDRRDRFSRFHDKHNDLGVSHTRGWLSYMNCCDRRKYRFNRVTLQDYYSDSESDGV